MPDITAEQLAEALTEFHLWVRPDRAPAPDPELATIGAIMAALAALDDADAVERVIAYVAHRCNVSV